MTQKVIALCDFAKPATDIYLVFESVMNRVLDAPLGVAARALHAWRPDWSTDLPDSSNPPSWYISPRRTVAEFVCWNFFFIGWLVYLFTKGPGWKPLELPKSTPRKPGTIDIILGGLMAASLAGTVWYKIVTNTMVYLLQPCHVVTLLQIYVCFCTDVRKGAMAYAIFVHANLGTLLALAVPDTKDYWRRGVAPELTIANFFFLHYLLALVPLYYEWTGEFRFKKGLYAMFLGWMVLGVLHFTVLLPASLISEQNVNYLLSPPPGPLRPTEKFYRTVQTPIVYLMLTIQGLIFPFIIQNLKRGVYCVLGKELKGPKSPTKARRGSASNGSNGGNGSVGENGNGSGAGYNLRNRSSTAGSGKTR